MTAYGFLISERETIPPSAPHALRGVMVEAPPASTFEVSKAEFLLELLVVALDAPAQLGQIDQALEGDVPQQ